MAIIIIVAKLGILAIYASIAWMVFKFKESDRNVKLDFDLLSSIELCAGIGIALVGVMSTITPSTYTFTLCLCLISILVGLMHRYRIILAGETKVLFAGKTFNTKEVIGLATGTFTLKIFTKKKREGYSIYVPLTSNDVLRHKVQEKIKKNKK